MENKKLKLNYNGGKLKMASEKVNKALQMLKEEGIETNIIANDKPEDETTGEIGEVEDVASGVDEGLIVERSDTGAGFQMYRDYSKDSKFKRLCR